MRLENGIYRLPLCQERLSSLTTFSVENTVAQKLEFSELVKIYADVKTRNVNFQ